MLARYRNSGYSLVEVLVAMAILALSLTILLRIFGDGLRNIDVSDDYTRALLIAESQLELAGTSIPLASLSDTGVVAEKFRWTRTIDEYHPFADVDDVVVPVSAYSVTVDVEWTQANRVRSVNVASIKLVHEPRAGR